MIRSDLFHLTTADLDLATVWAEPCLRFGDDTDRPVGACLACGWLMDDHDHAHDHAPAEGLGVGVVTALGAGSRRGTRGKTLVQSMERRAS